MTLAGLLITIFLQIYQKSSCILYIDLSIADFRNAHERDRKCATVPISSVSHAKEGVGLEI